MIELLKNLDTSLFLFLNGFHSHFFDGLMYAVSYKFTWIPFYISLLYVVIKSQKKNALWIILALVLCIVIADQISSGLIKNLVQRLRPSRNEDLQGLVHLVRGYTGGKFGFVSSHAANTFGLALLTSLIFKQRKYTLIVFAWAVLTAYSRIYLGVHYPLDIVGGILVGVFAASICYLGLMKFRLSALKNDFMQLEIPVITIGISLLGIICYSIFLF